MSSDAPGLLLVLSAPSGAGKTTLARMFLERDPDARFSISATTRAPRGAERDGVDYHFVSGERFDELIAGRELAEWAEVHGARYGTLRSSVEAALAQGHVAVFDIDVQGGTAIQSAFPGETVSVLVLPPSMEELARRLRARSTESGPQIARRLAVAREEIDRAAAAYDYLLVNDELEPALARLRAIVAAARARRAGTSDGAAERLCEPLRRGSVDLARWLAAPAR